MSVSTFLKEIGRPVAYYPTLSRVIGSVKASVLLCQLLYWSNDRGHDPDGWIYKTQQDIEAETGLSRRMQESAREKLKERGVLEEMRKGTHGTLHFRVNMEALDALWRKAPMAESAHDQCTNAPNANGGKRQSLNKDSETTSENTTETTGEVRARDFLPEWLDPKTWASWVVHRQQIKHPITERQAQAQFRMLDKFRARGMPASEVIEQSIANGWQGLFELKPQRSAHAAGRGNSKPDRSETNVARWQAIAADPDFGFAEHPPGSP